MQDLYQFGINACSLAQEHKTKTSSFLIPQKLFYNTKTTFNNAHYKDQGEAEPWVYYTLAFPTQVQIKDEDRPKMFRFCRTSKDNDTARALRGSTDKAFTLDKSRNSSTHTYHT